MTFSRNFIYSLVALTLTTAPMMAQCPPSGYPQPGNTCAQAPLICQSLNGYCATINNNNTPQVFPGCPNWTLNNDEWLAFFAGSTSISIQVTPSNCSPGSQMGLQGGIYAACASPWMPMDLQCSCTENPFILESSNFIVGKIYYLVLDGCSGSICDYSIQVLSGSTLGFPPGNPGPVSGPAIVCQTSTDYSVDSVAGSTSYNWALNPSSAGTINGNGNSSITINWSGNITGPVELCVTCSNACFANATPSCRTIEVYSPVLMEQTTTPVTCPGGADGVVALNVSGGTMPYSYQWNNGQTTATATGLVAGAYTVTVTDFAGCTGTISATVTQPDVLTITKTITNVSSPGGSDGSVVLSVTGGTTPYLYLWSNGQATATATGLAAGTYTATVTDNKGCTATTSATVTQPTPTLLAVSANTIRIKYYNTIAPATATAANLPIWGDETGLRTGTYSVSADTVTFVANTAFRAGELIHITSKSSLQFTGGGATIPFSWVCQSVVTNPTTPVFDTTGSGIILPSAAYSATASYNAAMADVNRDGRQDLVFRYHASYGAATNILVYIRNANGTFAAPATYTNSESHSGLVGTPDVNNDGYPDIVLFHNVPSRIHVRLNNGSGGFGAAALYSVNSFCNGAKVYDMDNDGDLDIIAFAGISALSSNTISVLKNNGNGTFAAQISTNTSVFGTSCQPADLDNDGDMDLAYTSNSAFGSSKVFRVYRNDGTGALTLNNSEANNLSKQVMSAFDYNADGNVDLITSAPNGEIYLNNAGINYTLATPTAFTSDYSYSLSGDLDGDGDLDIFNANSYNGTSWNTFPLKYFLNNGSGTFTTTTTALVLPVIWTTDLSDYDSDGDLDHIYLNPATGEIKVLLNGNLLDCTSLTATATAIPAYCGLANGAVTVNVAGGTAPFSYLWNNAQTTVSITGLTAGTYMATVTDGAGCTKIAAATVTSSATFPIQKAITNVSCPGGANGAVALSASGGTAPYNYLWNNSLTTATVTGLTAGVYSATATDANGCTATTTAAVTQPVITPAPANECPNVCIHCDLDGYMGSTDGYTGNWVPGFCGTIENEQWIGFVATASTVTITATPSNCTQGNGVQLALYPDCTGNPIACNIGLNGGGNTPVSITASVTPGVSYYLLVDGYAGDQCDFIIDVTPAPVEVVRAAVKVILQGPYVSAVQLMHDSLRTQNLIPLTEQYTGLTNFTHVGGGGGETTTAAVLAVTGPNAVVDWVFLELRSAADPALVLATRSALVQRDGDVVDVDGVSPVAFRIAAGPSYFLAVRHRNHLGVQLGAAKPYPDCVALATDFREQPPEGFYAHNGLSPAQRLISGRYALWAGNGRVDTQLKYNGSNNDRNAILSVVGLATPNAVVPGYRLQDYNLDGVVKYNGSANDRNVLLGNVGIGTPSAVVEDQVAR